MVWDVAAGLALVQGAGGKISFQSGTLKIPLTSMLTITSYHQKHD